MVKLSLVDKDKNLHHFKAQGTHSGKQLTLSFGSGDDLWVLRSGPASCSTLILESARDSLLLPLALP